MKFAKIIASSTENYKLYMSNSLSNVYLGICVYLMQVWGCPRGVMVKAMDCRIVVREFELQSRYYVHFRAKIWTPKSSQLWVK